MMRRSLSVRCLLLLSFIALGSTVAAAANAAEARPTVALVSTSGNHLQWTPLVEIESVTLALAGPQGGVRFLHFGPGESPSIALFDAEGAPLPDGIYTWELRATEPANPGRRATATPLVQSGYFRISGGSLVAPAGVSEDVGSIIAADQLVPDDLIVDGKGCIGLGCVNNETFFAEALRLKQSVVRLRFEDTSTAAGLPARDWQLTLNDAASGGADRFSLDDLTAGTTPFTVLGGAPDSSLHVDGVGNVGLGTATPAQDLHIASSNTPAVRLEQTGSPAQTWDLTGSHERFAIRDVTGTRAPLQIETGAPSDSVHVKASGFVGLGTSSPTSQLHVRGSDPAGANIKMLVENTAATTGSRELFEIRNNGGVAFIVEDTSVPERWAFSSFSNRFLINNQANPGLEFDHGPTGNLTILGVLIQNSDRSSKEALEAVAPRDLLAKVSDLPLFSWSYIQDSSGARHVGPMAQDFRAAFGLGEDERHIALGDLAGVSLAAIQGLHALVEEQRQTIEKQQEWILRLEERLRRLEASEPAEPTEAVQP